MERLAKTARLFRLLADSKRLRLLKLLESGEGYSAGLSAVVNLSRATTSRYLNAMAAAGFLARRGTRYLVYFSLAAPGTPGGDLARLACSRLEGDKTVARDLQALRKARTAQTD